MANLANSDRTNLKKIRLNNFVTVRFQWLSSDHPTVIQFLVIANNKKISNSVFQVGFGVKALIMNLSKC